jgi:hypothetical protein
VPYSGNFPEFDNLLNGENNMRTLAAIARDIRADWKKPYFAAVPYLQAMQGLGMPGEYFGQDEGKSIVLYFLANAGSYRGEKAREYKAELKAIAGVK